MNNFVKTFLMTIVGLVSAGFVYAGSLTVRIESPKSPTTLTDLKINFVVLDYASNGGITAKCYFKKNDGSFTQFGDDIALATGGGSAFCSTTSNQINGEGTYTFYVTASNAEESITSQEVSVSYNTSAPGTPTNYGKSRVNACDYKISFRTADDNGKTVKVEIYRSSNTSFTADAGTRVDTITIGSNTDGSSVTTAPNCNTDYFFAVRAFDSAGVGSGLVGDSVTTTTTTTTTTTAAGASGTVGAIPAGTGGNILGVGTAGAPTGASGAILGEESTPGATPTEASYTAPAPSFMTPRNIVLGVIALAAILWGAWLLRKRKTE